MSQEESTSSVGGESSVMASKLTSGGNVTQDSVSAENTIITRDQGQTKNVLLEPSGIEEVQNTSTEKHHEFSTVMNRWIPMKSFKVTTSNPYGTVLASYRLPEDLISTDNCTPNVLPFQQFIYGNFDIDLMFKINANKFQVGRLVIGALYDPSWLWDSALDYLSSEATITRQHVFLDICGNSQVEMPIRWMFHRPMIRAVGNSTDNVGVRGGVYALVQVKVLSQMDAVSGQKLDATIVPFFKFKKARFTGMSYARVPKAQMMSMAEALGAIQTGIKIYENCRNMDKPTVLLNKVEVIPRPRMFFTHGKGFSDAIPMRLDPSCLTTYKANHARIYSDDSILSIARIWGLVSTFQWAATDTTDSLLWYTPLGPANMGNMPTANLENWTPIEYVSNMFMFWRGTMEYRFDFIANSFHTGTLMISIEFGRADTKVDACKSASTYVKYVDLGEQKTFTLTIPYIFDTVWRRTRNVPFTAEYARTASNKYKNSGIIPFISTRINVRVVNELKPIASVPQAIKCLVYCRAGPDFELTGLCQSNLVIPIRSTGRVKQFPLDYASTRDQTSFFAWIKEPKVQKKYKQWFDDKLLPSAEAQMMSDVAEDEDKTHDLTTGIKRPDLQTTESHNSIKDIMRRPVLIESKAKVTPHITTSGTNSIKSAYFICCMPPSVDYLRVEDDSFIEAGCIGSPQVMLTNLFRFWRGSLRYTLVFYPKDMSPIYVYHVPKSGNIMMGNQSYPFQMSDPAITYPYYSLGMTGMACEIVVPTINPTVTIEIPYLTECDWSMLHSGPSPNGINTDFAWRDKGDNNIGHIAVETSVETLMDVWVSVGDDFEMTGFIGIPGAVRYTDSCVLDDNMPKPSTAQSQMYFDLEDVVSPIIKGVGWIARKGLSEYSSSVATTAAGVAVAGAATVLASVGTSIRKDVTNLRKEVTKTTSAVQHSLVKTNEKLIDPAIELVDYISSMFATFGGTFDTSTIALIVLELYQAWSTGTWSGVGMSVVKMLLAMKLIQVGSMSVVVTAFSSFLMSRVLVQPQADDDINARSNLLSVLFVAICTGIGVRCRNRDEGFIRSFTVDFLSAKSFSMVTHVTRFIKETFSVIKEMVFKALGYSDVRLEMLQMLDNKSVFLKVFVEDAQKMLLECNSSHFTRNPMAKVKYWATVCNAMQINKMLVMCPEKRVSPALMSLCRDVISKSNEQHILLSNCPVRYEPYVIFFEGATNIGKSYMNTHVSVELLKNLGISNFGGEVTYVKNPGPQYWNGYRDQPVIIFDEFLNINSQEAVTQQISDFYTLKSCAIFNPNMAQLEQKELRANPLLLMINSNNGFPQLSEFPHPEAILRRRDVVVSVRLKSAYEGCEVRNIDKDVTKVFGHLEFSIHSSSLKRSSTEWLSFDECLILLKEKHLNYHQQEKINVRRRIDKFSELLGDNATRYNHIVDPFCLYYQTIMQLDADVELPYQSAMPSEQLEWRLSQISEFLDESFNNSVEAQYDVPVPSNFTAVLQHYFTWWSASARDCAVCSERCIPEMTCLNETDETSHSLCTSCYVGLMQASLRIHCPMCRGVLINPADTPAGPKWYNLKYQCGRLLKNLILCGYKYYKVWQSALDWSVNYSGTLGLVHLLLWGVRGDVVSLVNAGSFGIMYLSRDHIPFWSDISPYRLETVIDESLQNLELPMHAAVNAIAQSPGTVATCPHSQLLPQRVFFCVIDGNEHVGYYSHDSIEPYHAPFKRCAFGCAWRNEEDVNIFLNQWRVFNRNTIDLIISSGVPSDTFYIPKQIWVPVCEESVLRRSVDVFKGLWRTYLSEPLEKIWHFMVLYWDKICMSIAAVGGVVGIYRMFMRPEDELPYEHSAHDGEAQIGPLVQRLRGIPWVVRVETEPQSQNSMYSAVNCVADNMGQIVIKGTGVKELWLTFTGWYGKYALCNQHYLKALVKHKNLGHLFYLRPLSNPDTLIPWTFEEKSFISTRIPDVLVVKMPPQYPIFKDLRKKIATVDDVNNRCIVRDCIMIEPPTLDGLRQVTARPISVRKILPKVEITCEGKGYFIENVVEYDYSRRGACGAFILSPNLDRPIVAIHGAGIGIGSTGTGYGICLLGDQLADFATFDEDPVGIVEAQFNVTDNGKFHLLDNLSGTLMSKCSVQRGVYVPAKSAICESLVAKFLPAPKTMIVALSTKDPRYTCNISPLAVAVNRQGVTVKHIPNRLVQRVSDNMCEYFLRYKSRRAHVSVLETSVAIRGFDGLDYYDAIDMTTSAGFPWCLEAKMKGKHAWFKDNVPNMRLQQGIDRLESHWKKGILTGVLFMDIMKDERRKKLQPRLINAAPVDYVIAVRKYILDFMAAMMDNKILNMIGVGITPDGKQWGDLYRHLSEYNAEHVVEFDYKNFGPGLSSQAVDTFIRIVCRWYDANSDYSDEDIRALRTALYENVNCWHVCGDLIYQQVGGSPSGSPITAIVNTFCNLFYLLVAWHDITGLGFSEYLQNVRSILYGDDGGICVRPEFLPQFNGKTIAKALSVYGVVITSSSKDGEPEVCVPWKDFVFLKRKFVKHPERVGEWLAPVSWDSVEDCAKFVRKTDHLGDATYVNCVSSTLLAFGHGREIYEEWRATLNDALVRVSCPPLINSWIDLDERVFEKGEKLAIELIEI